MAQWIAENWPYLAMSFGVAIKALNLATHHFQDHRGVVRWCLFALDLLDVIKTSHGGTHGGIPGSKPPKEATSEKNR